MMNSGGRIAQTPLDTHKMDWDTEILTRTFQKLFPDLTGEISAESYVDHLLADQLLSFEDMDSIQRVSDSREKARQLLLMVKKHDRGFEIMMKLFRKNQRPLFDKVLLEYRKLASVNNPTGVSLCETVTHKKSVPDKHVVPVTRYGKFAAYHIDLQEEREDGSVISVSADHAVDQLLKSEKSLRDVRTKLHCLVDKVQEGDAVYMRLISLQLPPFEGMSLQDDFEWLQLSQIMTEISGQGSQIHCYLTEVRVLCFDSADERDQMLDRFTVPRLDGFHGVSAEQPRPNVGTELSKSPGQKMSVNRDGQAKKNKDFVACKDNQPGLGKAGRKNKKRQEQGIQSESYEMNGSSLTDSGIVNAAIDHGERGGAEIHDRPLNVPQIINRKGDGPSNDGGMQSVTGTVSDQTGVSEGARNSQEIKTAACSSTRNATTSVAQPPGLLPILRQVKFGVGKQGKEKSKEVMSTVTKDIVTFLRKNHDLVLRPEYVGSSFERAKIEDANEFDVLIILDGKELERSELHPQFFSLRPRNPENPTLKEYFTHDGYIDPEKVYSAMQKWVQKAVNTCFPAGCDYHVKLVKSGPAATLKIAPNQKSASPKDFDEISVDLVPAFEVLSEHFVPKPMKFGLPSCIESQKIAWRKSFSLHEKERLLRIDEDSGCRRQCLKLLKYMRLRDPTMKILASYHYKILVIQESDRLPDKQQWTKENLAVRFWGLLESLETYLKDGRLPHFVDERVNVFESVKPATLNNIKHRLMKIRSKQEIPTILEKDPV